MTKKADLQKELLTEVKEGIKPSDLKRKLKRSRSLGDIPTAPPPPPNLEQERQNLAELLNKSELQNNRLKAELNKITQQLKELHNHPTNPPTPILTDQLKEKQKQIETLRANLEKANNSLSDLDKERKELSTKLDQTHQTLTEANQALDKSLEARLKSLKDWEKQQTQIKALNQELDQTIDQASTELVAGDNQISQLRTKVYQLKITKEKLERELKLARINRPTHPQHSTNQNYGQYALYFLLAVWMVSVLNSTWEINLNELNNHD